LGTLTYFSDNLSFKVLQDEQVQSTHCLQGEEMNPKSKTMKHRIAMCWLS